MFRYLLLGALVPWASCRAASAESPAPPTVETRLVLDQDQTVEGVPFRKGTVLQLVSSDRYYRPAFRYIKQATLAQDQLILGIPFRKGSVVPFEGRRPTHGVLSRDARIENIPLQARTKIWISYDRARIKGTLSRRISLQGVPYAAHRTIALNKDRTSGVLAVTSALRCLAPIQTLQNQGAKKTYGTLLFQGNTPIRANREGLVQYGVLARDQLVKEFELPRGTALHFSRALPTRAELPKNLSARRYKILGVAFKDGSTMSLQFYPQTEVGGRLARDTTFERLDFAGGTALKLSYGQRRNVVSVLSGTLSRDHAVLVDPQRPAAGSIAVLGRTQVHLARNRFRSGVLAKNTTLRGIEYARGYPLSLHEPWHCSAALCVSDGVLAREQTIGAVRVGQGVRVVLGARGALESLTQPEQDRAKKKAPGTAKIRGKTYLVASDLQTFLHATGTVQQGRLAEDATFARARLKQGTICNQDSSGQLIALAPDERSPYRPGFHVEYGGLSFDANHGFRVEPSRGVIETGVLYRGAVLGGVPLPAGARLSSLAIKTPTLNTSTTLERAGTLQGLALDRGSSVRFVSGRIAELTLARGRTLTIDGLAYKTLYGRRPHCGQSPNAGPLVPTTQLLLFPSGKVKKGALARDQTIQGVHCQGDHPVELDASGTLRVGFSARQQQIKGRRYGVGERFELR